MCGCFQSDTKDAGFKMIESSMEFLSNWIAMQQKMGSKTYSSCQSLKSCPGTTTDQSWLTNKSQWRAASGLLFIIFWWNSGLWRRESRCHQSTWWNGGAAPVTRASVSHLTAPGSVWKSHAQSWPQTAAQKEGRAFTDGRVSWLHWG